MYNRMAIVAALGLLYCVSCGLFRSDSNAVNANATCVNLDKYQSSIGVINSPKYHLGTVLLVDTLNHRAARLATIVTGDTVSAVVSGDDSLSQITNSDFDVSFDAAVSEKVKAEFESHIDKNTSFVVHGGRRVDIRNVIQTISADSMVLDYMKFLSGTGGSYVLVLISSMIYANEVRFSLNNTNSTKAGFHVVKVLGVNFQLTYNCNGALAMAGKDVGMFFKTTGVSWDAENNRVVAFVQRFNWSEFYIHNAILEDSGFKREISN